MVKLAPRDPESIACATSASERAAVDQVYMASDAWGDESEAQLM
jgi:hypothetical protein